MPRKKSEARGATRRSFLVMSVAGGAGVLGLPSALVAQQAAAPPAPPRALPEGIVSPADSLANYAHLAKNVRFEAFRQAGKRLATATLECSKGLLSLTDAVRELEDALRKSKKETPAALKGVRKLGSSSSELLKSAKGAADGVNAAAVTGNVCDAVESVLAEANFNSTPSVAEALEDVLCKARKLRPLGVKTGAAQQAYTAETSKINTSADEIEELLVTASISVTEALEPGASKAAIKESLDAALSKTRSAVKKLTDFVEFAREPSTAQKDLPTRRVLMDALDGTQNWIEKMRDQKTQSARRDGTKDRARAGAGGGARVINASLSTAGEAAPEKCDLSYWDMGHHFKEVKGFLKSYCKPATDFRASICISYAKPAWEKYCGKDEREDRIRTMGDLWLLIAWKGSDKWKLVQALADYDLRK